MDFEKPIENNDPGSDESNLEKDVEINNTSSFIEALEVGNLEEAESWMMENKDRHDDRWLDHRSGELFRAYRQNQDWESAKRMIDLGKDENSRRGRRLKLAEESGETY